MEMSWKNNIYSAIESISDIEFQKKAWFDKSSKYVSSFNEVINILYDDCLFEDFIKEFDSGKSNSEFYKELSQLDEMIENYNPAFDEKEIIVDPKWHQIVKQAQKIIRIWDLYVD